RVPPQRHLGRRVRYSHIRRAEAGARPLQAGGFPLRPRAVLRVPAGPEAAARPVGRVRPPPLPAPGTGAWHWHHLAWQGVSSISGPPRHESPLVIGTTTGNTIG